MKNKHTKDACQLALQNISKPSYRNIKMILESNQDKKNKNKDTVKVSNDLAFVRGSEYYGGKNNGQ